MPQLHKILSRLLEGHERAHPALERAALGEWAGDNGEVFPELLTATARALLRIYSDEKEPNDFPANELEKAIADKLLRLDQKDRLQLAHVALRSLPGYPVMYPLDDGFLRPVMKANSQTVYVVNRERARAVYEYAKRTREEAMQWRDKLGLFLGPISTPHYREMQRERKIEDGPWTFVRPAGDKLWIVRHAEYGESPYRVSGPLHPKRWFLPRQILREDKYKESVKWLEFRYPSGNVSFKRVEYGPDGWKKPEAIMSPIYLPHLLFRGLIYGYLSMYPVFDADRRMKIDVNLPSSVEITSYNSAVLPIGWEGEVRVCPEEYRVKIGSKSIEIEGDGRFEARYGINPNAVAYFAMPITSESELWTWGDLPEELTWRRDVGDWD